MDFNDGPKVPFPWGSGYWPVSFSSDEALQIAGLFHQGQFPYCSGYEARRVQHFPDFNLESIFITKNIFIMKNRTDSVRRWKTVWIRACPIPRPNCPLGESPTTSHCQVECWHVWLLKKNFFIMNFLNFLRWKSKSWKTTVWDSNDSNKTGMGFALSRDLFYFGFFVAAAEFRLGFGRC